MARPRGRRRPDRRLRPALQAGACQSRRQAVRRHRRSSFAAAQGKDHPAQLAAGDGAPKPAAPIEAPKADAKPEAKPSATAPAAAAEDAGPAGGVVQIAAYSNEAQARSGWDHLVQQHEMLKGMNHRIVQGQSDIGTVFRLQLLASAGGGSALCGKLKAEGIPVRLSIELKGRCEGYPPPTSSDEMAAVPK
jgi:hypothetical protein